MTDPLSSPTKHGYDYEFVKGKSSFKGSDPALQQRRVDNLAGHAVNMLKKLKGQNEQGATAEKTQEVFKQCLNDIQNLKNIQTLASTSKKTGQADTAKTPKEIRAAAKKFKKEMKGFEKSIAKIMLTYQMAVLKEHAKLSLASTETTLTKDRQKQIDRFAKGGIRAFWIRTKALFFSSDAAIVKAFAYAQTKMLEASKTDIAKPEKATEVQQSQLKEFTEYQKTGKQKRDGVLSVGHTFRFVPNLRQDKILKQFKAFCAQSQSLIVRTTIKKELSNVEIEHAKVTSTLTPLNKKFDALTQAPGSTFEKIHGDTGSSSAHREGHHLSNAYLSELSTGKKTYYQAIRHAILSSNPKETNKKQRKADALQQAKELLTAAVMKDFHNGLDITASGYRPTIISTSLVTPFLISGGERQMWNDQREALSSLNGQPTTIQIGDKSIPVTPNIHAFNFGVNKGAVKFGLGAITQYFQNRRAIAQLENSFKNFSPTDANYATAKQLLGEIRRLTQTPWSYLGNGNQYEVGAKLICLANMLGYTGAINCKSAKDRTQILDSVAKTFMTMYAQSGKFPTSEELKTDKPTRENFKQIFATMVKESGGLEITEINTGALGLKVDEMVLICGFSLEELLDIQGTSATAGA